MNYVLHLPPDTRNQITAYLSRFQPGTETYRAISDAVLDHLNRIRVNPQLGAPVYGGPLESRRILRFEVSAGGDTHDLQFAYKIYESNRTVVISGFDQTP
jgi:hypothetical protein